MRELIRDIDWSRYNVPGKYSPEISPLVEGVFNEDRNVASSAARGLGQELAAAFDILDNDLPFVLAPILIVALISSDVMHKDIFVGLLTELANLCDLSLLTKLVSQPPPPHPRVLRLNALIRDGYTIYRNLRDSIIDSDMRKGLDYILQVCEYQ